MASSGQISIQARLQRRACGIISDLTQQPAWSCANKDGVKRDRTRFSASIQGILVAGETDDEDL